MTTLVLGRKDDNAILEPSALVVRCALVNTLYYRNVSCEWVSCQQIFQDGFYLTVWNLLNVPLCEIWITLLELEFSWNPCVAPPRSQQWWPSEGPRSESHPYTGFAANCAAICYLGQFYLGQMLLRPMLLRPILLRPMLLRPILGQLSVRPIFFVTRFQKKKNANCHLGHFFFRFWPFLGLGFVLLCVVCWLLVVGCCVLLLCCCVLVVGCWLLVVVCCGVVCCGVVC